MAQSKDWGKEQSLLRKNSFESSLPFISDSVSTITLVMGMSRGECNWDSKVYAQNKKACVKL